MTNNLEQAWNGVASNLRGYIRTRISDHFATEDILQDVYLKAHTHAPRLSQKDENANLQAWLFQIARNAIIDHLRKSRPSEQIDESMSVDDVGPELADEQKLKASFRNMILNLPEPYREAVALVDLDGLTQKELADRLGISLSGAKSRVQRGRQLLKQDLLQCCEFEFDRRGKIIDYIPKTDCCSEGNRSL